MSANRDPQRSTDRVMVFIDGQNLYKGVSKLHRLRVHPVLIAREFIGTRTNAGVRYYSGVHQPRENPDMHGLVMRRHKLMRRTGVTVIERSLRYHWEWSIDDKLPPPHRAKDDETHKVRVSRRRVAREKGIDLALGIDAVTAAVSGDADTIIIVSRDRDLAEVAKEIRERDRANPAAGNGVTVEVGAVVGERAYILDGYDHTHFIDRDMAERCRDDFDYRKKLSKSQVAGFLTGIEEA